MLSGHTLKTETDEPLGSRSPEGRLSLSPDTRLVRLSWRRSGGTVLGIKAGGEYSKAPILFLATDLTHIKKKL